MVPDTDLAMQPLDLDARQLDVAADRPALERPRLQAGGEDRAADTVPSVRLAGASDVARGDVARHRLGQGDVGRRGHADVAADGLGADLAADLRDADVAGDGLDGDGRAGRHGDGVVHACRDAAPGAAAPRVDGPDLDAIADLAISTRSCCSSRRASSASRCRTRLIASTTISSPPAGHPDVAGDVRQIERPVGRPSGLDDPSVCSGPCRVSW